MMKLHCVVLAALFFIVANSAELQPENRFIGPLISKIPIIGTLSSKIFGIWGKSVNADLGCENSSYNIFVHFWMRYINNFWGRQTPYPSYINGTSRKFVISLAAHCQSCAGFLRRRTSLRNRTGPRGQLWLKGAFRQKFFGHQFHIHYRIVT